VQGTGAPSGKEIFTLTPCSRMTLRNSAWAALASSRFTGRSYREALSMAVIFCNVMQPQGDVPTADFLATDLAQLRNSWYGIASKGPS
jgi:hypothetical protein